MVIKMVYSQKIITRKELTSSICRLIEDNNICRQLSKNARDKMQEYNCDKIVNKWFDFMKEVCNNEKNN